MKRRNLLIIGAITAAITSFSLHAAFGYSYWNRHNDHSRHGWYNRDCSKNEKEPARGTTPLQSVPRDSVK